MKLLDGVSADQFQFPVPASLEEEVLGKIEEVVGSVA
jgi:hypothetical protein